MEVKSYKAPAQANLFYLGLISLCLFKGIAGFLLVDIFHVFGERAGALPFPVQYLGVIPSLLAFYFKYKLLDSESVCLEGKKDIDNYLIRYGEIGLANNPNKPFIKGKGETVVMKFSIAMLFIYVQIYLITMLGFFSFYIDNISYEQFLINVVVSVLLSLYFSPSRLFSRYLQNVAPPHGRGAN